MQPEPTLTLRPTNPLMEQFLSDGATRVLDHGFLRLIDYMGDESSILRAARVSYGAGTKSVREDRALIRYLMRNRHTTPFEMCEIVVHAKLPIFVARQWVRHRMASINEMSARYSVLDKEFYIPDGNDLAPQSTDNKQGRAGQLTQQQAAYVRDLLLAEGARSHRLYEVLLGDSAANPTDPSSAHELSEDENFDGLARELARMNLSLNFYTQWYWKTDIKNFMDFLSLRNDPHAQLEIRAYAEHMEDMLRVWMPNVYEAFLDYRRNAVSFSGPAMQVLHMIMEDYAETPGSERAKSIRHELGKVLEKRELDETLKALGLTG